MVFTNLTPDDQNTLDSDREFVASVLELRFAEKKLTGTDADIGILQEILDGGPYTDDAVAEVVALGTALGDLIGRTLNLSWVRLTDEYGSDLGVRYRDTTIVIFPRDMIIKRIERDEQPDLGYLYKEVIREVKKMIASRKYQ